MTVGEFTPLGGSRKIATIKPMIVSNATNPTNKACFLLLPRFIVYWGL